MEGGSADEALARCLACARATPPDQRTPEVAAFIESDDLLAEVKQLLPLNAEGQAAEAGDGPELRRRALLAALKVGGCTIPRLCRMRRTCPARGLPSALLPGSSAALLAPCGRRVR